MDVLGTILGLLYIYLEFKENIWMWIVGCVMPVIYFFVLLDKGVYGDCATEVYAFGAGLYGLWVWMTGKKPSGEEMPITRTPKHLIPRLLCIALGLWIVIATILRHTDSTVAYLDALSTTFYLIALWMLARKYLEQWWVWFACDLISTGLYIYKGVYGRAILYGIYTAMAIYGYFLWKKKSPYPYPPK